MRSEAVTAAVSLCRTMSTSLGCMLAVGRSSATGRLMFYFLFFIIHFFIFFEYFYLIQLQLLCLFIDIVLKWPNRCWVLTIISTAIIYNRLI